MAKLPDALALGERPKPEPLGRSFTLAHVDLESAGAAEQGLGKAVYGAGEAVFAIDEKLRQAREASQLSDVLGKAATELGEKTLEFARDQDYKTSPQRFQQAATEIGKRHAAGITNEFTREAFQREYNRMALGKHLNVLTNAAKQEGDANVAQLDDNLDTYAKAAAAAENPLERDTIMQQARLAIASNRKAGWISDVDAVKREHQFAGRLDHATVLRDISVNAEATADKLANDQKYAPNLDPLTRQQVMNTALVQAGRQKARVQPEEARVDAEAAMRPEPASATVPVSTGGDGTQPKPGPQTATDVRAQLPAWIAAAEKKADARHPGDLGYRDLVVGRVKNYVSTLVAAKEGEQRQAYTALMGTLGGVNGKKPTTQDELFAIPGMRDFYSVAEPQQQAAVLAHLNHNANEAIGKPAVVNAKLVNQIFPRLFLDPQDPKAITQPQQLAQFVSQGLTPEGHSVLARKIDEIQRSPDGRGFAADVEAVRHNAAAQLRRSIIGATQPEQAEYAAIKFIKNLDKKIDEYRKAGKDPRALLDTDSPDYAGRPDRVMSFLSTNKPAEEIPPRDKMTKLDARDPEKSFNDLPPGAWYVAPDGRVGRKPDSKPAAPVVAPAQAPAVVAPSAPKKESPNKKPASGLSLSIPNGFQGNPDVEDAVFRAAESGVAKLKSGMQKPSKEELSAIEQFISGGFGGRR